MTALEFLSEEFLTFASFLVGVSTVDLETSDPKVMYNYVFVYIY